MAQSKLDILIKSIFDDKGAKSANDEMRELDRNVGTASSKFSAGAAQFAAVGAALTGVALAAREAYQFIGEGAELDAARQKFENLAGSIDTTADSLLTNLRAASKGMISDAELIAGATDIINVGLASTEDETVRLATAVATLGLDMQQVILTFANNSKARLDSLGLSIAEVDALTEEFVKTGKTVDEAFDLAVLTALENKMELLGDASETTAGQMAILEASAKDMADGAKVAAATIAGPLINALADGVKERDFIADALGRGIITIEEFERAIRNGADVVLLINTRLEQLERISINTGAASADLAMKQSAQIAVQRELDSALIQGTGAAELYAEAARGLGKEYEQGADDARKNAEAAEEHTRAIENHARRLGEAFAGQIGGTEFFTELSDQASLLDSKTGALTATARDVNTLFYEQAAAAGVSGEMLAQLGTETGLLTEEQAEAALAAAAMKVKIDEIATGLADGTIPSIHSARTELGIFIDTLNGIPPDTTASLNISVRGLEDLRAAKELLGGIGSGGRNLDFELPPGVAPIPSVGTTANIGTS